MRTVALDELEKHVATYVRAAEAGETVLVTDRVVARLLPVAEPAAAAGAGLVPEDPEEAALATLEAEGVLTWASAPRGTIPPSLGVMSFEQLMKDLDEDRADRW
jgi:antitoxin (DNA-binding transcriptional repressor) of toxin-antitoxin stability system